MGSRLRSLALCFFFFFFLVTFSSPERCVSDDNLFRVPTIASCVLLQGDFRQFLLPFSRIDISLFLVDLVIPLLLWPPILPM